MKSEVNLCKLIRSEFGMTQAQFADEFSIPLRTVQGWESRSTMPMYIYIMLSKYRQEIEKWNLYRNAVLDLDEK